MIFRVLYWIALPGRCGLCLCVVSTQKYVQHVCLDIDVEMIDVELNVCMLWYLYLHCSMSLYLCTGWMDSINGSILQWTCWRRPFTDWGSGRCAKPGQGMTIPHLHRYSCLSLPIQEGWTALIRASDSGNVDIVCVLLEANAHINQKTKVMLPTQTYSL